MPDPQASDATDWRRVAIRLLKAVLVVAVAVFVWRSASRAWGELATRELEVHPGYALAAAGALVGSQVAMAWFWRRIVLALGQPAPLDAALAAYLISQIGKYVPGKASVVLIRVERLLAAVRRRSPDEELKPSPTLVGAAIFYEAFTHMAVGSLLAAVLATVVPIGEGITRAGVVALAFGLAAACLVPTLPPVFAWLLRRVTSLEDTTEMRRRLTYGLAAQGALASLLAWSLVSLGVYCSACAVGAVAAATPTTVTTWLLAGVLPVVAGFVSLLPAGVLVREAVSLSVLGPLLGEADALATTVAVRLIWVATEAFVCGSLLAGGALLSRRVNRPPADRPRAPHE